MMIRIIAASLGVLLVSGVVAAFEPDIRNASTVVLQNQKGLDAEVTALSGREEKRIWIAWNASAIEGRGGMCCHTRHRGVERRMVCPLDDTSLTMTLDEEVVRIHPAGTSDLVVLARLGKRGVEKVAAYRADCALDADGASVYRIEGVKQRESVDYLSRLVGDSRGDLSDQAMLALALHDGPAAQAALERFTEANRATTRKQAGFWLGATRGRDSLDILRRMVMQDPNSEVREQSVFAVSMVDAPEATDLLIDLAKDGETSEVRSQALFWLAEKAGSRVSQLILDAVTEDPDLEVKQHAVFALSQLPQDEAVPLLIDVARSNRNAEVRRAAMFWLGESNDPRALEFFERILLE
jgi:HEAT repeat protein